MFPIMVQPIVVYDEEDLDAEYRKSGEVIAVPLTVSIVVLAAYTILGAIIFRIWEDWNFADAAYFSFVTIATIGFGDLVPGIGRLDEVSATSSPPTQHRIKS
ncbi:hypothetical protein AHF37_07733 [Paragonimus kellicotti]|nr:hypothetical protein AHF37_07733 [Paragonimus kellicotti]